MYKLICSTLLIEKSPQALPLGAACIASAVKNAPETKDKFSAELIDFCRESPEIEEVYGKIGPGGEKDSGDKACGIYIAEKLLEKKPDFVCLSIYVWNHVILETAAKEIKKQSPATILIGGGPEVTADPFVFEGFDYTTAGAGEGATVQLLEKIADRNLLVKNSDGSAVDFNIPGIYAAGGKASGKAPGGNQTAPLAGEKQPLVRTIPCNPEVLSSPYLDGTIDVSKYGGALWELARGCPFKCSYCYESKGEKKVTYFPMDRLEKEIELFARKNISQVFVLDPTYNASKERAVKMLKIIEKKAPGMFFYFEARAEFIDRELAKAFSRVPCALQIGLQSADENVLKNVHRTLDKKKFIKNIGFLNEEGVTFGFDLIFGLPGDTLKGFRNSIDFAISLYPNNLELFCLSVLPGTDLYDSAKGFGLEWEKTPPYHVLKTPEFPEKDLARAAVLARATNLFYTQGRAVPWFNSVIRPLKMKPSQFFTEFADFMVSEKQDLPSINCDVTEKSRKITLLQKKFVTKLYRLKHLDRLIPAAEDLITINGALGLCTFDGTESEFTTNYYPDDVMSEYGTDLQFFADNCGKEKCRVRVFVGENGPDWTTV